MVFHMFWNIRKNSNWSMIWFICSSTIFFKIWWNSTSLKSPNPEKNSQNSFINLIGISIDCTACLLFKSFMNLLIWFFVTGWNVKLSSEFVMSLLIPVMLRWFWYFGFNLFWIIIRSLCAAQKIVVIGYTNTGYHIHKICVKKNCKFYLIFD